MKRNTRSTKQIVKALSIGLSASMLLQPITAMADANDDNHGKIFQGLKYDLEINLNDYEKVAEIGLSEFKKVFKNDIDGMLESIFSYGNTNKGFRQKNPNARSISVSDII